MAEYERIPCRQCGTYCDLNRKNTVGASDVREQIARDEEQRVRNGSPRVSVLIPVHNPGSFLLPTVDSVLKQTWTDFELVLIDDGSTEDSLSCVTALGDPRIRIFRQEQQGAPAALNTALRHARGEFVAFLDQDDLWHPSKLQAHLNCHWKHPETDLSFSWSRLIDEQGADLHLGSRRWYGPISFQQVLQDFVIGNTSAIVVRRAAIAAVGGLNPGLPRVYDIDLTLRIARLRENNCRSVPQELTLYRRHSRQMSRDWRRLSGEWQTLLRMIPGYAPASALRFLPLADCNMRRYFAWLAFEQNDFRAALMLVCSAVWRSPARALLDSRNWMLAASAAAGLLIPAGVHRSLMLLSKRLAARLSRGSRFSDPAPPPNPVSGGG
jgi:glycosyltransferase involved in cell wall biosynthesis